MHCYEKAPQQRHNNSHEKDNTGPKEIIPAYMNGSVVLPMLKLKYIHTYNRVPMPHARILAAL